jgi:hypothetical protein
MSNTAFGWIYPEHRDIAVLAVEGLDPERKAEFDRLWQEARVGDEARLCAQGADTKQGVTPECIDWAALSGIAGDHSCSSQEMMETVRESEWVLQVADVAAQLKEDLARIPVTATPDQTAGTSNVFGDTQRSPSSPSATLSPARAGRSAQRRKLLWHDQIPPRSYLLGYVNADRWSIAIPVAQELPGLSFLFRDEAPRTALVEGAIDVVVRTLADRQAK